MKKYLHFISFNCEYHEKTWYTLYSTTKPEFKKSNAISSLRQGKNWETKPSIVTLDHKYNINDAFSIKVYKISNNNELKSRVKELNKKYSKERHNYITYL